jgi:hypothetical protein
LRSYSTPSAGSGTTSGPSPTVNVVNRASLPPRQPMKSTSGSQGALTESDDSGAYGLPARNPEEKIDASLKNLATRVRNEGSNGSLALDGFEVKAGRVQLIVTMTHVSRRVLAKLKSLGFAIDTSSNTYKMVRGSIAVDKIEELAKLTFVEKIEPYMVGKGGKQAMSTHAFPCFARESASALLQSFGAAQSMILTLKPCGIGIYRILRESKAEEYLETSG